MPEVAKLFPEENRERQFKMLQLAQRAFLDSSEDDSFIKRMPNVKGHKGVRFEQYEAFNRAMQNTIAMADPRWDDTDISKVWQETSYAILLKLKKVLEEKGD